MTKSRLWRVDAQHIRGAHAPHLYLETESKRLCDAEAEALKAARELSVFYADKRMRKFWSLRIELASSRKYNGKWYTEEEYRHKSGWKGKEAAEE